LKGEAAQLLLESSNAAQFLRAGPGLLECFMLVNPGKTRLAWIMNIGF